MFDAIDHLAGGFEIDLWLGDDRLGGPGGGDDDDRLSAGTSSIQQRLHDFLRLIEMGFGVAVIGDVAGGIAVVDDEDIERGMPAKLGHHPVFAAHGPGEGDAEQRDQQAPGCQQKPLLEFQPAAVFPHRPQQEFHRRPRHLLEPPAVEQMDDDRNGDQRQAGPDKPPGEEPVGQGIVEVMGEVSQTVKY